MSATKGKHPTEIVKRPLLTEKGTTLAERENRYLFEVATSANKIEIKRAVERLYEVRVADVATQVVRGKEKRVGRNAGRRPKWKKAIVKLAEGASIDFFMSK